MTSGVDDEAMKSARLVLICKGHDCITYVFQDFIACSGRECLKVTSNAVAMNENHLT